MSKPRKRLPVIPSPPKNIKAFAKVIVAGQKDLIQTREKLDDLKKQLGERTHQMLKEEFGTYIQTFDAMVIEHQAIIQLFIEKKLFTRKELDKRYLEIKEGQ